MRILDLDHDSARHRIILYLTVSEASELRDSLESILAGSRESHEHVMSADGSKEVTVCLYSPDDPEWLKLFDDRSQKLIATDT